MNWSGIGILTVAFVTASLTTAPLVLVGCAKSAPVPNRPGEQRPSSSRDNFDDHTIPTLHSEADLLAFSFTRASAREVKFIVSDFSNPQTRAIRFIDSRFYQYHDEWYWFRLLNGQLVPGDDESPYGGRKFRSPTEATTWAIQQQPQLPSRLQIVEDGRLYAPRFYRLALEVDEPAYGLGSVFQLSADEKTGAQDEESGWAFELEYGDKVDVESILVYFSLLKASIPLKFSETLVFVARSPQQHAFVELMRAKQHPLAPFLKTYSELAKPGAVQVYNAGLMAGVLRVVSPSELDSFESKDTEILVLPLVPDYLPAAAGIVSSVPQTPLSHVNLLARNRGIPNVYLGQAAENRHLNQLARTDMPVVMLAENGRLAIEALDDKVYQLWKKLTLPPLRQAPVADAVHLPYTRRLRATDFEHVEALRPAIGGKAAGMLALLAAHVSVPRAPLALTVRPYVEHLAPLMPWVERMLVDQEFLKSARVRYLVLEGRQRYDQHFSATQDQTFASEFVKTRSGSQDVLFELIRQGGLTGWIRSRAIDANTLSLIVKELHGNFPGVLGQDGLRFRSSSTIEDIEGFNGAGLYESHTGFLDALRRTSKKERGRTVEDAILRTWASYWGWEAFEERQRARVDHLSGRMGLLIHPRFQDELELGNGVISLTINRRVPSSGDVYDMELNVQHGAESVTNPDSGVTPEVLRVRGGQWGALKTERLAHASGVAGEGWNCLVSPDGC